jgi:hypothetical protein
MLARHRGPARAKGTMMVDQVANPYREMSDDSLIGSANVSGPAAQGALLGEIIRRLKDAVVEQNRASTALAKRITDLNEWLLWVTIAIGALTVVQIVLAGVQVYIAVMKK